jgi:pyruvate/2-oxoglutarate/acetoin dehydrogenase E1 component
MKYLQHVNGAIRQAIEAHPAEVVMFGQNIAAGSCLGGLTRNLPNGGRYRVLNTPNVENTMVGVGFGMMMAGVSSIFFMKQQDFLLLGIDHLVNTYNYIRQSEPRASFTIVTIVVDQGYQGIQSSLNNFADFCSIARVPGYSVTNLHDVDAVIGSHLLAPGFRILGVSQRLFHTDVIEWSEDRVDALDGGIFRYARGADVTLVACNFAFPQAVALRRELRERGTEASLFSVSAALPVDWTPILADARRTRKAVLLDDSKSANRPCYALATALYEQGCERVLVLARPSTDDLLRPHPEEFVVDADVVLSGLGAAAARPI